MLYVELTRGERFKDARIEYNQHGKQTMDEVATATGVSKANLSAIENDKARNIGADSVVALAKHYGVSADWLLGLTGIHREDSTLEAIERYTGMSEKTVKRLSRVGMLDKRETLDWLLSAEDFPALLDALKSVEASAQNAEFNLNYSGLSVENRKASLEHAKERLENSTLRVAVKASKLSESIYNVIELEKKLDEAIKEAADGEHTED